MIVFQKIVSPPLVDFEASAPDGAVMGIVGEDRSGKSALLRLAGGAEKPAAGSVVGSGPRRYLGPGDALNFAPAGVLLLNQTLAGHDALVRERAVMALDRLRRSGTTTLLVSHDDELVRRLADEVWWLREGRLAARGAAEEVLAAYRKHIVERIRAWGESVAGRLDSRLRRGDGRAEIVLVETIGEDGRPTAVWRSGELAVIRVKVRFHGAVEDPVVGILIRTRIGLSVYGTNTELEKLKLGPCAAGEVLELTFAFRCELCAEHYTLTAASHDPDGVWHDWLEDAVAFSVADTRYSAGVANLRATVSLSRAG
jgi:lipopolysaccharide transport system ATP-binding protein